MPTTDDGSGKRESTFERALTFPRPSSLSIARILLIPVYAHVSVVIFLATSFLESGMLRSYLYALAAFSGALVDCCCGHQQPWNISVRLACEGKPPP
jgi:hypothetical protein